MVKAFALHFPAARTLCKIWRNLVKFPDFSKGCVKETKQKIKESLLLSAAQKAKLLRVLPDLNPAQLAKLRAILRRADFQLQKLLERSPQEARQKFASHASEIFKQAKSEFFKAAESQNAENIFNAK